MKACRRVPSKVQLFGFIRGHGRRFGPSGGLCYEGTDTMPRGPMDGSRPLRAVALASACALVWASAAPALAQDTIAAEEESGTAAAEEGSVVEGSGGGLDIGMGTVWLGVGAMTALGLVLAISADNSRLSGTTGTSGTGGTSGSN